MGMPNTIARRRWFQFGLGTMLSLVTLVAIWLAYYLHWKDERREARAWIDSQGVNGAIMFDPRSRPELPWMLRLLGEKPERILLMLHEPSMRNNKCAPPEYERLVQRVTRLFPEAQVFDFNHGFVPDESEPGP
jgi:hypothetical protein